jgi:hypothetical protein
MKLDLEFSASADCEDISIAIYINNSLLFDATAKQATQSVTCELSEEPGDHVLTLVMSGKNHTHTTIDDTGKIISDVYVNIDKLEFEELDMKEIYCLGKPCYTHSFNSTQPEFLDEFYGIVGCNGTVKIEFSTPIHLWLLDHI